jgi:TDG/mug DNA glycosylase family protein
VADYREVIEIDGRPVLTRADIVPERGPLRMLIVGKTPTPSGLAGGHYFQGRQGRMLWRRLAEHGLLEVPAGRFPDEVLLDHGYGITNIVKQPHPFGVEPSAAAYRQGLPHTLALIERLRPRVALFVYKRALDQLLRLGLGVEAPTRYGLNPGLAPLLGCQVFAFPLPGTPCRAAEAGAAMAELRAVLLDEP